METTKKNHERKVVAPAMGAFLCECQKSLSINGKHVSNATIIQATMMAPRTYNFLKKGRATISAKYMPYSTSGVRSCQTRRTEKRSKKRYGNVWTAICAITTPCTTALVKTLSISP